MACAQSRWILAAGFLLTMAAFAPQGAMAAMPGDPRGNGDNPPSPQGTQADVETARTLLQDGPVVSLPSGAGAFTVQGFLRGGWPIVVDYAPQPGTRTLLTIVLEVPTKMGALVLPMPIQLAPIVVDPDGNSGRRLFKLNAIDLPAVVSGPDGPKVVIADFSLQSYKLQNGQVARDDHNRRIIAPLQVIGIGAGPRAVGSISITDVQFGPATISQQMASASASFSYLIKQGFDHIDADIWRECGKQVCNRSFHVKAFTISNTPAPETITGTWPEASTAPPGAYDLYVRAWLFCNGSSGENYGACGDEAAWATGFAGPIQVTQ
jgi:hypothetical protein